MSWFKSQTKDVQTEDDPEDCKACQRLRSGLTWTGLPPKCPEHRDKTRPTRWQT